MFLTFFGLRYLIPTRQIINDYLAIGNTEFQRGFVQLGEKACARGDDDLLCRTLRSLHVKSYILDCILTWAMCWFLLRLYSWLAKINGRFAALLISVTLINVVAITTVGAIPTDRDGFKISWQLPYGGDVSGNLRLGGGSNQPTLEG